MGSVEASMDAAVNGSRTTPAEASVRQTTGVSIVGQAAASVLSTRTKSAHAVTYEVQPAEPEGEEEVNRGAETATRAVVIVISVGGLLALYGFNVPPLIILRIATIGLCGIGAIESAFAFKAGKRDVGYVAAAFSAAAILLLVVSLFWH